MRTGLKVRDCLKIHLVLHANCNALCGISFFSIFSFPPTFNGETPFPIGFVAWVMMMMMECLGLGGMATRGARVTKPHRMQVLTATSKQLMGQILFDGGFAGCV
uniref:Uncharacterized protein n=1 Tax=Anopheles culicifacies TaxID=139723 RepID=A0A182LUY2_9DIPT